MMYIVLSCEVQDAIKPRQITSLFLNPSVVSVFLAITQVEFKHMIPLGYPAHVGVQGFEGNIRSMFVINIA